MDKDQIKVVVLQYKLEKLIKLQRGINSKIARTKSRLNRAIEKAAGRN